MVTPSFLVTLTRLPALKLKTVSSIYLLSLVNDVPEELVAEFVNEEEGDARFIDWVCCGYTNPEGLET